MSKNNNRTKLELNVGRAKAMYDDGYTTVEIAKELGLSESTVRSYKEIIDKAEANRK